MSKRFSSIKVISHRGYSSERPENTISSFDWSIESGFPFIELDIHLTSDQVPIVMHDKYVDRTTDGSGAIKEFTLAQIKELDAGSWFDPKFIGETVPTLEEILVRYSGKAHIFVELKSLEEILVNSLRELITSHGWMPVPSSIPDIGVLQVPGVSVISFAPEQVLLSKNILPELGHGLLLTEPTLSMIEFCVQNSIEGFFPFIGALNADIVIKAHESGLYVGAWGMSSPSELATAVQLGIDGVTVDWPKQAQEFLENPS
ncbi:MAG: glycerophosphodiester phosphodiesterase family protein [Chloroflexota bacterium]|nr:glycerophosphodiester phosphodiesterase family protein [Chloroflexota bacterium]